MHEKSISANLLRTALEYAARGWPVLPLQPRDKRPLAALVPRGLRDASVDGPTIRRWWAREPLANLGVVTGLIATGDYLSVLDLDLSEARGIDGRARLAEIEARVGGSIETAEVLTGGGGSHLYFVGPHSLPTSAGQLAVGIDTRGGRPDGTGRGYVVAPPSIHASGKAYVWELSGPAEPSPVPDWLCHLLAAAGGPESPSAPRGEVPRAWAREVPHAWRGRAVEHVAQAALTVAENWHDLYLALAGALAYRREPLADIPAILRGISLATGADDRDRGVEARSTVRRYAEGHSVTGARTLASRYPRVAVALEQALGWTRQPLEAIPLSEAETAIAAALARSAHRSILQATTGAGKSRGALAWAGRRAEGGTDSRGGARPDTRTVLSAPTHALSRSLFASEMTSKIRAQGVRVARLFSPASALDEHGAPICQLSAQARAIASGGFSVGYELCRGRGLYPCDFVDDCAAADGLEGDRRPQVLIAVHDLLSRAIGTAGKTAHVIIDEPPSAVEIREITRRSLDFFLQFVSVFDTPFRAVVEPVAVALLRTLGDERAIEPSDAGDQTPRALVGVELADLAEFCLDREITTPPVRWAQMARARADARFAARLGEAGRVASLLIRIAVCEGDLWTIRVEPGREAYSLAGPSEALTSIAAYEGRATFLDACPDVAAIEAVCRCPVESDSVLVRDGAPTSRTHVRWRLGSRSQLCRGESSQAAILEGVTLALAFASENPDARALVIFTYLGLRALLDEARGIDTSALRTRAATSPGLLEFARGPLRDAIAPWISSGKSLDVAHYGATRGLDAWRDFDTFVTLGDATSHLDSVRRVAAHLGIAEGGRFAWEAARELEQAHGRARSPSRTAPARHLHLGVHRPLGLGWTDSGGQKTPKIDFAGLQNRSVSPGQNESCLADLQRGTGKTDNPFAKNHALTKCHISPLVEDKGVSTRPQLSQLGHRLENHTQSAGFAGPTLQISRPDAVLRDAIAALCLRFSCTRAEIAAKLRVSRKTLARYESGQREIPTGVVESAQRLLATAPSRPVGGY